MSSSTSSGPVSGATLTDQRALWLTIYRATTNQSNGLSNVNVVKMLFRPPPDSAVRYGSLTRMRHPTDPERLDPDAENIRFGGSAEYDIRAWQRYKKQHGLTTVEELRDHAAKRLEAFGIDPATVPIYDNVPLGG